MEYWVKVPVKMELSEEQYKVFTSLSKSDQDLFLHLASNKLLDSSAITPDLIESWMSLIYGTSEG
jgi:hypothetical protein